MAYVSNRSLPQRHGGRFQPYHVISTNSLSNWGSLRSARFDPYPRQSERFESGHFDQYIDSPSPSNASTNSFGGSGAGYGPRGIESPATMFNDPFMPPNSPGYGFPSSPYTPKSLTQNLWSLSQPLTNIKAQPNRLPSYFPNMNYSSSPGSWRPNPNPKGHNRPPCPRCARKGPNFVTRYHPCKGFPCNNCKRKTLKYDGTGGLNAHQCATDRGGTPEHQQKEHKPQRRLPVYPMAGTHWARLKPGDKIPAWKVEHPGVAMGYTQAEMDDVCPGCGGWEWCWCYSGLGEDVDGWALEQENYRVWAEHYEAMNGAGGSSRNQQGVRGTGGASGLSQRRSDDARVTKRKPKKSKVELGKKDGASTQVHRTKAVKSSRKASTGGDNFITGLVGDVLKNHYQQKGKQPAQPANDLNQPQQLASRPTATPKKSKVKLGMANEHLAQARQWQADLLAKHNAGLSVKEDLVNVEADRGTDLQIVAQDNVEWASGSEDQVQSFCKELALNDMERE